MYAAAGGASLASRRAGQRQRQKKVAQLKSQRGDLHQKPQKQFHNYTEPDGVPQKNILRPPTQHERRHSTSNYLKEPSKARIRESPSISIPVQNHQPLSPRRVPPNHLPIHPSPSIQSQLPQIHIPEGEEGKLERRCSFVRQVEEMEKCQEGGVLDRCNHICNFEIKDITWDNTHTYYTEYDQNAFGSLDYPFSEVVKIVEQEVLGAFCVCNLYVAYLVKLKQHVVILRSYLLPQPYNTLPSSPFSPNPLDVDFATNGQAKNTLIQAANLLETFL